MDTKLQLIGIQSRDGLYISSNVSGKEYVNAIADLSKYLFDGNPYRRISWKKNFSNVI
jgi:hypothetical protein